MFKQMSLGTNHSICWLLSLTLVLQPPLVRHSNLLADETEQSCAARATHDDITLLLEKLHSFGDPNKVSEHLDTLEKFAQTKPAPAFDVASKAHELGKDIDAMFAFVRDAVRYEVYPGVLRGSRGTLMAMAGNSFDKSLLLAELLKTHGVNVRFVRGQLDADHAEALVSQMFQQAQGQAERRTIEDKVATELPLEFAEGSNAFAQLIVARWTSSLECVSEALRSSEIGIGSEPPVPKQKLIAEAADHCWLEVQQGDTWKAFDASFQNSEAGKTFAATPKLLDDLPQDLHQRVVVRLSLEQRTSRGMETSELLQHQTKAADLHGAAISLHHELASENSTWTATTVLRIDDVEVRGEKISAPAGGVASGVNQLGSNLFNRAKGEASVEQGITAMWLEFDFISPSGMKETVRRDLFDRIGIVARTEERDGKAPLTPLPANGLPPALSGIFAFSFCNGTLHPGISQARFARHIPLMRKSIGNGLTPTATSDVSADEHVRMLSDSLSLVAASFHQRSKANIQQAISSGVWNDVWFYEATPRLAIVHFVPASGGNAAENTFEIKIDLRRNNLRAVAARAAGPEIIWANVHRGLLDAALEHVMFVDSAAANASVKNSGSTIALVEHARQNGVKFQVVKSQTMLSRLHLPADAKLRLQNNFRAPLAFIAPASAVPIGGTERTGWWQVDLASGETLAVMDTGLHEGGMLIRWSDRMQDSVELGLMHYVQALIVVGCMTVFPAVVAAWFWGEIQSQAAYRRGFNDGLNRATDSMVNRYDVPDPRDGAIDYSVPPPNNR